MAVCGECQVQHCNGMPVKASLSPTLDGVRLTLMGLKATSACVSVALCSCVVVCCSILMRPRAHASALSSHPRTLSILFLAAALAATLPSASTSLEFCHDIATGKREVVASSCGTPPIVVYTFSGTSPHDHLHAGLM